MPRYPVAATPVARVTTTLTFADYAGRTSTIGVDGVPVTAPQIAAIQNSLADLSNAALIRRFNSVGDEIPISQANTFDEAYASISDKLVLVFQDGSLDKRTVSVPAPDAALFGADGQTAIAPDAGAAAGEPAKLLADAVAALEVGLGGTYAYVGGYLSTRSRAGGGLTFRPTIAEPGAGEVPDENPGT